MARQAVKPSPKPTAKSVRKATSLPAGGKKTGKAVLPHAGGNKPFLVATDVPGVFRNAAGVLVDEDGVLLGLRRSRQAEAEDLSAVLDGEIVRTPAQFMKAVALDPRNSLPVRLEAAKAAAPYTDRKMPQGVDGGTDPETGAPLPIRVEMSLPKELMASLTEAELEIWSKILGMLKKHDILQQGGTR